MKIDLCEKFKGQNIEGIEKHELVPALNGTSEVFGRKANGIIIHKPSKKAVVLGCAREYFEPEQSYYKLNEKSRCAYVRRALNVNAMEGNCDYCIASCIENGLKIKPKKMVVSSDYYKK